MRVGASWRQRSTAMRQRGLNRQPGGILAGSAWRRRGRCRHALTRLRGQHAFQQRLRIGMAGLAKQRIGFVALDDPAEIHHRDFARHVFHDGKIVADQEIGQSEVAAQVGEQIEICACTETSSALVGSSQSRSGSSTRARPIAARWRCPPDNAPACARPSRPTAPRARECSRPGARSRRREGALRASGKATMSLIRRRGLREANGSWNTGWISRARALRSRSNRRLPLTRTVPAVGLSSPRIMRASVDLPQPNSPTMPSTLPAGTLKVTSSTATTRFSADINPVWTRNSHAGSRPRSRRSCGLQLRPVRLQPAKIVVRFACRRRGISCSQVSPASASANEGAPGKAAADRRHHARDRAKRPVALHTALHRHADKRPAEGCCVRGTFRVVARSTAFTVGSQMAEVLTRHKGGSRAAALERAVELMGRVGIPRQECGSASSRISSRAACASAS